MDLAQLKLIVDMITGLGENGKEAFIWWLVMDNIPSFLLVAALLAIVFYIAKRITDIVQTDNDLFLRQMRDALRIGSPGPITNSERRQTQEAIKGLVFGKDNQ